MNENKINEKDVIITGIRPSGNLTVANFIGSVIPFLDLQKKKNPTIVFVATMHGLTDKEPSEVMSNVNEVVKDYLALGLDPTKITIFDQRSLRHEVSLLKLYLERHITVSRLTRVPTLKDKLKKNQTPEQASVLLAGYPIMMAADILLQSAKLVPVGKDQFSHIEVARELAKDFNTKYGRVFVVPDCLNRAEPINILSLRGDGKMSKSEPEDAIFLTDDKETIERKIKRAETALPGEKSEKIDNLAFMAKILSPKFSDEIDELLEKHEKGEKVMVDFKRSVSSSVISFVEGFQKNRAEIDDKKVEEVLRSGGEKAMSRAKDTLSRVEEALGIK